jgi:ribulose 1,5-bisphosphate synthetase/thiazole synthase
MCVLGHDLDVKASVFVLNSIANEIHKKKSFLIFISLTFFKVPPSIDVIVIGSGSGGLATAVILAKAGKRVLCLEQFEVSGGPLSTFEAKGYEFNYGVQERHNWMNLSM